MKLTKKWLRKHNVCEGFYNWYKEQGTKNMDRLFDLAIKDKRYDDVNWIIIEKLNRENKKKFVIYSAECVLPLFEKKYPNNSGPRKMIEKAKERFKKPTEENKDETICVLIDEVENTTAAIDGAYYVRYADHVVDSTYAPARDAYYSAVTTRAAHYAAATIYYAARAIDADYAVVCAASRAICAAGNDTKLMIKILKYGLELVKEGK